jgi:small subunit ribosomal protein S20
MPNTLSAKKELRKSQARQIRNKKVKDTLKNLVKKGQKAITAKDTKAKDLVASALKAFDKAAQKGIIKKNTRDRKKSRLHKKLNASLKA